MKKIFIIIIISVFIPVSFCGAQTTNSIEGKVTDAKTGEPLAFVNVFLSQTTIGASTDGMGVYKIGKIPSGNFILVASMVGYESKTFNLDLSKNRNAIVNFSLERSIYQFSQIEVKDEIPTRWFDQLEIFKKQLFGNNNYADKCVIKNPYQIDFKEESSRISASAREPIVIENHALGYKIECVLKSFIYDINSRTVSYQIYPSFTEITTTDEDSTEEFLSNRKDAYLGSMAQLLSSLALDNYSFRDAGFELRHSTELVTKANQIVQVDSVLGKYFLKASGCISIKYWNFGKRNSTRLCLSTGITEFDPSGFLINADEFTISGDMAHEGVATMLPRFWKLPEEN